MKNKVLSVVVVGGMSVLALSGCAKDNKAEFFKYEQELSKTTYQKFDMSLKNVAVKADDKFQMYAPMINGYLSDIKLSGDTSIDGKNKVVTANIKLLGQDFPFEFLIKGDTPYMKLDTIGPMLNFYLTMASQGDTTPSVNTDSLKNKYVDLIALGEEKDKNAADLKSITANDSKKATDKVLNSLEKSKFTKDGSAITLSLTGKELGKLVQTYLDELPKSSQDSVKSATNNQDIKTEISKVIKSSTITLDNKNKTAKTKLTFSGEKTNGIGLSGYITYNVSFENKKVSVKLPNEKNIIKSSDELTNTMSKLMPTGLE